MKSQLQSVCQLFLLGLCFVVTSVRESDSTFVPGRCLCPATQNGIRGQLKELSVFPKSASCNKITVIVTLKSNNERRCLNPDSPLGKQLIRCWNRAHNLSRDPKLCLKRRRRRGGLMWGRRGRGHRQHRGRGLGRRISSSNSQ